MNISLNTKALLASLLSAIKVVPSKTALPILENFLVNADNDAVTVTASNSESTIVIRMNSEQGYSCAEAGSAVIPARHLLDIVKECNDSQVSIKTLGNGLQVRWSAGYADLPTFNVEDYPAVSKDLEGDVVNVDLNAEELVQAITSSVYATAEDLARPMLSGLLFDIEGGKMTLVATDGLRLACCPVESLGNYQGPESGSACISKKDIAVLKNELELGRDETAHLSFSDKNAVFTVGNTVIIARCLVGKFPKWRGVIPSNNENVLVISRDTLVSVIRRISVCANKTSNHIKFTLESDLVGATLTITAQDLGFGLAAFEKVPVDYHGSNLNIGFKGQFVIDAVNGLRSDKIKIRFSTERKAVLVLPAEDGKEGRKSNASAVLMPIAVA